MASANVNINDGATRTLSIDGPGQVYGGVSSSGANTTITYNTLEFQRWGTTRQKPTSLVDIGITKTFSFRGGINRLKLTMDTFNVFNISTVLGYSSNNKSSTNFTAPSTIVPPRVIRFGATFTF